MPYIWMLCEGIHIESINTLPWQESCLKFHWLCHLSVTSCLGTFHWLRAGHLTSFGWCVRQIHWQPLYKLESELSYSCQGLSSVKWRITFQNILSDIIHDPRNAFPFVIPNDTSPSLSQWQHHPASAFVCTYVFPAYYYIIQHSILCPTTVPAIIIITRFNHNECGYYTVDLSSKNFRFAVRWVPSASLLQVEQAFGML